MPKTIKKNNMQKEPLVLEVGNIKLELHPMDEKVVARADARIQKKVQPIFAEIRRARRAAALSSSKIILNA